MHLRKRLTCSLANGNVCCFTKMQKFVYREEKKRHEEYGAIMHHDLCVFVEELNTINPIDGKCRQQQKAGKDQEYFYKPKIKIAYIGYDLNLLFLK